MIRDILEHPVSWAVGVFATFTALEPTTVVQLATATWANLGQLFSFTMIAGITLPKFWPPTEPAEYLVLLIGMAFAAKIGHGIWKSYDTEL